MKTVIRALIAGFALWLLLALYSIFWEQQVLVFVSDVSQQVVERLAMLPDVIVSGFKDVYKFD